MNAGITPYVFEDELVRVHQDENGDPWFVAKDVCRVLDLTNASKAVSSLDDDEKGVTNSYTLGGEQEVLTVSESGLYALIFRSRKPQAKTFRKWVTSEVLPAIRKVGRYELPTAEERDRDLEAQIEGLKALARGISLRATHRVQMMNIALQISKAEGTAHEVDVLSRYISLCESVAGKSAVTVATADEELVRRFVDERLESADDADVIEGASLYSAYCAWCDENGNKARSLIWFGKQIGKYFERFKSSRSHYRGARLLN
jgi:prophage antirepressor-like protein